MSVSYSLEEINARLGAVVTTIDGSGNGNLFLSQDSTVISTIQLARPSGVVSGGVLTFDGTLMDPAVAATGSPNNAIIKDGAGTTVVSGLTVGSSSSHAEIIITNGLSSTLLSSGQVLLVTSAVIRGT